MEADAAAGAYELHWGPGDGALAAPLPRQTFPSVTYDAEVAASWLALAHHTPMKTAYDYGEYQWMATSMDRFGRWVLSEELMQTKGASIEDRSTWLYDRPATLYFVYFATGDLFWKHQAHAAALTYRSELDDKGYFGRAPGDLKYVSAHGLLLDQIFFPDAANGEAIEKAYQLALRWPVDIPWRGFWTERHTSIALSNAITHWELSRSDESLARVRELVEGLRQGIHDSGEYQCMEHSYEAHEGERKSGVTVCSPWMTALIIEQLWRGYFHLEDLEMAAVISSFGSFLEQHGTYMFAFRKDATAVPKYLAQLGNDKQRHDAWSDFHHACDVAAAMAKSIYTDGKLGRSSGRRAELLESMLATCKRSMARNYKKAAWPVMPVRKFNWWYNGFASFTWLLDRTLPGAAR